MRGLCAIYSMCIQVYNVMDLYSRIYSSLNKNLFFFSIIYMKTLFITNEEQHGQH